MVDYAYRELFYKSHQTKDILIVDSDAVVTPVSGAAPTVEDATVEIHTADIKTNSFTLDESICSEDDLKWGLLESSAVSFTIRNSRNIPNLKNTDYSKALNIYIYFNGDSNTLFQVGQYICGSDKYSADRRTRKIELYDVLHFLYDEDITAWYNEIYADNDNEPLTVKELRDGLFDYLYSDYDYPVEQNEETELVNDDCEVPKNIESDTITFGFFMGGILDANGVMGHIGRTGLFEYITLVKYDAETVATVTDDFRKPPTTYEDFAVWGIGYVRVYDRNNIELTYQGSSSYRHPSVYNIIDNFVLNGILSLENGEDNLAQAALNIREQVTHRRYAPMDVEHVGDLCVEVGDNIKVTGDIGDYNTYVLERHLKGLGSMLDEYISRGNRKQPKYQITNDRWHIGDSELGTSGSGAGGISKVVDDWDSEYIEKVRNNGFRFLDEPQIIDAVYDEENGKFKIKWQDPDDLIDDKPCKCVWAGTYVVKIEGDKPPKNIYQGTVLANVTTKNAYKTNWFEDNNVNANKKYYYAIMPYDTKDDVRWTCCISVNTGKIILAPLITDVHMSSVDESKVTVNYNIPSGTYSYIKLVYKKDRIPTSYTDGTAIDITQLSTSQVISGIADGSTYWFVIFTNVSESDPAYITTANHLDILLDSTNSFISPYASDFVSYCDVFSPFYFEDYVLRRGTAQYPNGTCVYSTNAKFTKGQATKLYMEMEAKNSFSRSILYIIVYRTKPTQETMFSTDAWLTETVIDRGYQTLDKTTIEVSLSGLAGDSEFYVGIMCADINLFVTKIYFDNPIDIVR